MKHVVLARPARRRPSITVVIPCYKYGHFLPAAVESVLSQRRVDPYVIIVDDASPDGSGEVAATLARTEPRVRAILHAENTGHIQTYNDGLSRVDTDYVSLVSADDVIAAGSLGRATALMEHYPGVGLVYGTIATFADDADERPARRRWYDLWRIWRGDEWIEGVSASGYNPIASPEAVVRTQAMRQIGLYNPSLPHSGDLEYWLRIAARWRVGQIHGPIQAYYRVHGGNMHIKDFGTKEADLRGRLEAFEVLLDPATTLALPTARERFDQARAALLKQIDEALASTCDADRSRAGLRSLRHELATRQTTTLTAP